MKYILQNNRSIIQTPGKTEYSSRWGSLRRYETIDPGPNKEHYWDNLQNLNKVCGINANRRSWIISWFGWGTVAWYMSVLLFVKYILKYLWVTDQQVYLNLKFRKKNTHAINYIPKNATYRDRKRENENNKAKGKWDRTL